MISPGHSSQPLPPNDNRVYVRRRRRNTYFPNNGPESHNEKIEKMGSYLSPSISFFLFSAIASAITCFGFYINSIPVLFLAVVLSPFMAPFLGISFASITGSVAFFLTSCLATLVGCALSFGAASLTGWLLEIPDRASMNLLADFIQLSWVNIFILSLGILFTVYFVVTNREKYARMFNSLIVLEIIFPTAAAGIGLVSAKISYFPDGLIVAGIHTILIFLLGLVAFLFLGIRPRRAGSVLFMLVMVLLAIITGICLDYTRPKLYQKYLVAPTQINTATRRTTPQPSSTPITPSKTNIPSLTPLPEPVEINLPTVAATSPDEIVVIITATPSPTIGLLLPTANNANYNQALSPTATEMPKPTPVWAVVSSSEGGGAVIRAEPRFNSKYLISQLNGSLVEILSEKVLIDNYLWVHVRTPDGLEGWMLRTLLVTATPSP